MCGCHSLPSSRNAGELANPAKTLGLCRFGGHQRPRCHNRSHALTRKLDAEAGSVIFEFAIALPFLFLMFYGIYDLSDYLQRHQTLTRVAYESARHGSSLKGLEPISVTSANASHASVLNKVRERAFELLELQGFNVEEQGVSVEACFSGSTVIVQSVSGSTIVTSNPDCPVVNQVSAASVKVNDPLPCNVCPGYENKAPENVVTVFIQLPFSPYGLRRVFYGDLAGVGTVTARASAPYLASQTL